MHIIKASHLSQHVMRALHCVITDAANQLPAVSQELVAQYLSADPSALVAAHAEDDFECAIEMDASTEHGRKLRLVVERILRSLLWQRPVAGEEVPDSEYKPDRIRNAAVRVGGSGKRVLIRTEPDSRYQFDFALPNDALHFITLLDGRFIVDMLIECAAAVRKQTKHNLLANMIGFHRHVLMQAGNDSSWFMTSPDHADLMADLHSVAEAPNYRQIVTDFIAMLEYRVVNAMFKDGTPLQLDTSVEKQRFMADDVDDLRDAWCVMAQCEPLAFLYAYAQLHAPLVDRMNDDVFEVEIINDEIICPKEFCVFLNTDNGGAPADGEEEEADAVEDDEDDDEENQGDEGLEPFEPVFDDEGRATNVGQNMKTLMDERLARDE